MRSALLALGLLSLSVAAAPRPWAVVVDIDSTITNSAFRRRIHQKVPLARAAAVLSGLEKKGVAVVYLSKRNVCQLADTVHWLARHGFPPGAELILRSDPAEPGLDFKARELARLKERFEILCAFGNDDDDRLIYAQGGLHFLTRSSWRDADWAEAEKVLDGLLRSPRGALSPKKE